MVENYSYFQDNFPQNLKFWFTPNEINPFPLTLLFLIGLVFLWRYNRRLFWFNTSFFLFFLVLYSMYTKGLFFLFGRHFRFTLIMYVPVIISSAFAATGLIRMIKPAYRKLLIVLLVFFLLWIPSLFSFFIFLHPHPHFEEYEFLKELELNPECILFTNRVISTTYMLPNQVAWIEQFPFKKQELQTCAYLYLNPYDHGYEIDRRAYLENENLELLTSSSLNQNNPFKVYLYIPEPNPEST